MAHVTRLPKYVLLWRWLSCTCMQAHTDSGTDVACRAPACQFVLQPATPATLFVLQCASKQTCLGGMTCTSGSLLMGVVAAAVRLAQCAASSLLQQLELLEAQQQLNQQQQGAAAGSTAEAALFLKPNETASADGGDVGGSGDAPQADGSPFYVHANQQRQQHPTHAQQQQQPQPAGTTRRLLAHVKPGAKGSPGGSLNNSLRRIVVGSPFNTISESIHAGGTSTSAGEAGPDKAIPGESSPSQADTPAVPATAAGAITHTATNVMTTIQSNVIAVVVKLLLQCGICFILTMMVRRCRGTFLHQLCLCVEAQGHPCCSAELSGVCRPQCRICVSLCVGQNHPLPTLRACAHHVMFVVTATLCLLSTLCGSAWVCTLAKLLSTFSHNGRTAVPARHATHRERCSAAVPSFPTCCTEVC